LDLHWLHNSPVVGLVVEVLAGLVGHSEQLLHQCQVSLPAA
jgi:hypothetical protein